MSTFSIFLILILIICFLLMLVVMVQNPKGGGLSSSFGGGGSQVVGGVKKTGDFLDKSTWILATMLIVLILASNVTLQGNFGDTDSKLLNGDEIETTVPDDIPVVLPDDVSEPATDTEAPKDSI
ncbi:Protein translocase membrane subunit SecG [hydrothermal vent metagenome]|uniref:Protein translocase membrane subunit SecG n=1 Tax=hydrothermal vent metagenome TaxID=652676 RepID=A0A3B0T5B5_9ZZZZ